MYDKTIKIAGVEITIQKLSTKDLKGITIYERLTFHFYTGRFSNVEMLFIEPQDENPTPRNCSITSIRLRQLFGMPVVFILKPGATYERQRLMDKNVHFIMSDKYAFLPMLVEMERATKRKMPTKLTPAAQYILLYHLQVKDLNNLSIKAIATLMPYSYESVALGITCLTDLHLCHKIATDSRIKRIQFEDSGKAMWDTASKFLISPVEKRFYCDKLCYNKPLPVCGINALSHYTMLNPDAEQWIMITSKQLREFNANNAFVKPNDFDGNVIVEVWKYPIVRPIDIATDYVDKLSLAISLRDDHDPRVEDQIEKMINEIVWKG